MDSGRGTFAILAFGSAFLSLSAPGASASLLPWEGDIFPLGRTSFSLGHLAQDSNVQGTHKGVDLEAPAGSSVYAVGEGIPFIPNNSPSGWYFSVFVRHQRGVVTGYTHLDEESVPADVWNAIATQQPIPQGTLLGTLVSGDLASHVHFAVQDCDRMKHINPLKYLGVKDTLPPAIHNIYVRQATDEPLQVKNDSRRTLAGKVEIIAEVGDAIDGQPSIYAPHRIEYQISPVGRSEGGIARIVLFDATEWSIDSVNYTRESCLMGEAGSEYVSIGDHLYFSNYSPDFPIRDSNRGHQGHWLVALTDRATPPPMEREYPSELKQLRGGWNTAACGDDGRRLYPDGKYVIRLWVSDIAGNEATSEKVVSIKNKPCVSRVSRR